MERCHILYPGGEFKDKRGCLKKNAHNDAHVFETEDGRLIEWEDDYNCKADCNCWEEGDPCLIYQEIKDTKKK